MLINVLLTAARAERYARTAVYIELQIFHCRLIVLRDDSNATTATAAVLTSMSAKDRVRFPFP